MAKVTKNPGKPAVVRKQWVPVAWTSDLRDGDVVVDQNARPPQVERVTTSPEVPITYTLELSQDEVQFLQDVFWRIGGHPAHSRRKFADSIGSELLAAGVKPSGDARPRKSYRAPDMPSGGSLLFDAGPDDPFEHPDF